MFLVGAVQAPLSHGLPLVAVQMKATPAGTQADASSVEERDRTLSFV